MTEETLKKRKQIILDIIRGENYVPMKAKELAIVLQVSKEERQDLDTVLKSLVESGEISLNKRGKYSKPEDKANTLTGAYLGTVKGFGFVTVEGETDDIYIKESNNGGALDKDIVQITLLPPQTGKHREGKVTKIITHSITEVVGLYQKGKKYGFVSVDNQKFSKDIYIPDARSKGALTGHKVVVKITDFGDKNRNPEGIIKQIIGHINDPGTDIMSIVKAFNIPVEFPDGVMKQVERIPDMVSEKECEKRLDLRSWQMVTIDGEDAKDLDDAVSLRMEGNIYKLGVHIADVTHYVTEGSPLDKEAIKRGTSVYLVDRVIPMLPHKLSNGICSLNAGVDRLALSCIMEIDKKGTVIGHQIAETVIHIDQRMTYTSVQKIVEDEDEEEKKKYEEFLPMFYLMKELAAILREKRKQRGSIDFDFPETKILLDKHGHPIEIKPYERNTATKIIEDFMLITNETIAEDFFWQDFPFVYRTHETPDPERIQKLEVLISNFGYGIKNNQEGIHPKELQKLLARIEDSPEEALISRLTLRSMKQARYTTACSGHFGLSAKYYCHFTSPIRRYPDLQIHRIIKDNLHGELHEKRVKHYDKFLNEIANQSSITERRADEAERETQKLKKVEYMSKHIGEVYDGVISGMAAYGMYVELKNTVEGMIHVTTLRDDYFYYDEEHYEMKGKETGITFKLGQKIKIVVVNTDKLLKTIDFELYEEEKEGFIKDGERQYETDCE